MKHRRIGKRALSMLLAMLMLLVMLPTAALAADGAQFMNGPYLLAPKTTSMVVAWEADQGVASTIRYGLAPDALGEAQTVERDATVPDYGGAATNLYRIKLSGLTPGEKYYYEVALAGGATQTGSFRTLAENPDEVRFLSITDTHKFDTQDAFDEAVAEYDPAFIIHGGDMVEGVGTQKEQYNFWFGSGDFIHHYPVVYACGNHDFSEYFDAYVINTQTEEYASVVPGNISFDYGDVHFELMDSNPWALFQMNAETSGGKMDASTADKIEKALQWLKDDLAANQDKAFRVLVMHHPESDPYTKRHIVPIAEAGNVDLMLAGHTHSYARSVSDDPTVGAGTVYLTHQDSRSASAKGSYMRHKVKDGLLTVENMAQGKLVGTTLIAEEKQQLSYTDISITPDQVLCNGEITVSATVKNTGTGLAAAVIPVNDNGTMQYIYGDKLDSGDGLSTSGEPVKVESNGVKTLEPGQSIELSGTVKLGTLGQHTIQVAGASKSVQVDFRPATYAYENIRTKLGDGAMSDINSDKLNIKADVTNIGNENGTANVTLYVDGEAVETKAYQIAAGQKKTAEFSYVFEKFGDFEVRIGDSEPVTVTIEGSIQGMPMIKDKSGKGNNGYLHGAPRIGTDATGGGTVILDGDKDYIEIPDNRNFTIDNGVTGMVWAKLPVSEGTGINELTPNKRDHNPLLTKGVSIGWGTNYLYRMAVRATGKITVGVGFDNDNGEFFWNDNDTDNNAGIKKGQWVQYVGGFDRATGGDSYQNKYASGHIDAPAFDSEIKNWPGASTYVGFSYTGALLTNRNRGIDRTMLAGEISQVRMYDTKLTASENSAICDNPDGQGAQSNHLVLWLDLDTDNIVQTGTHTTEWVQVSGAPESLSYDAALAGGAAIRATVEFSDNGNTASASKSYDLENGAHTIDLTGAGEGKYMRIVTAFTSKLGTDASYMPVLNTYTLQAGDTYAWNTYADWSKGTFADGAGHQSSDVYRALSKDFDDYSGTADQGTAVSTPNTPSARPGVGADVPASHWAYQTLMALAERGVIKGDAENGNLRPDASITREEVASALLGALEIPAASGASLNAADRSSAWAAGILSAAKEAGILTGDERGYLNGQDGATRVEVAVMIARAAKISSENTALLDTIADGGDVPDWARSSIAGLLEKDLMKGYEDGTLRVNNAITRAETFTLLYNILQ